MLSLGRLLLQNTDLFYLLRQWHYLLVTEYTQTQEKDSVFKTQLQAITHRPLSAETIDSYADEALSQLVELVQTVKDKYASQSGVLFENEAQLESAAFKHFGLNDIETVLDHISATSKEIYKLTTIIHDADKIQQVIIPPDQIEPLPASTGAERQPAKVIPRLKTLLFVLATDFGVDISDKDQLAITKGALGPNMARKHSYYLVEAPRLSRTALVCDEEGNASYIFDNNVVKELGLNNGGLIRLSKEQLNSLLASNPKLGKRIKYSHKFITNIIATLKDPASEDLDSVPESATQYLIPKAPEGVLSLNGMMKTLDAKRTPMVNAIEELGKNLGEVEVFSFSGRRVPGYNPRQQKLIREYLEQTGYYDKIPEDYLNASNLAHNWGVDSQTVHNAIEKLESEIGEVQQYRFKGVLRTYYNPAQQQAIYNKVEENGIFGERAPEGFQTIDDLAKDLGIASSTLKRTIDELGEVLGEVRTYKFKIHTAKGLSPAQQDLILNQLEITNRLSPLVPDGYNPLGSIADEFELSRHTLEKAVTELSEEIGEAKVYRPKTGVPTQYYSPEQQTVMFNFLEQRGYFRRPPSGFMTATILASKLGLNHKTVIKTIENLGTPLGLVETYKFANQVLPGYSPEQQNIIQEYLDSLGYFDQPPPGFKTANALASDFGIDRTTVQRAINRLDEEELGEVKTYKFGSKITAGYSPQQQGTIARYLALT